MVKVTAPPPYKVANNPELVQKEPRHEDGTPGLPLATVDRVPDIRCDGTFTQTPTGLQLSVVPFDSPDYQHNNPNREVVGEYPIFSVQHSDVIGLDVWASA